MLPADDTELVVTGHVLVAPDKFKGSLSAPRVAEAVSTGLRGRVPEVEVRCAPVADGGDGTVRAALATGTFRALPVRVTGPTGRSVDAEIAIDGETAVVELATASGLALLRPGESAPLTASSYGTGELVEAALDAGARRIVLGVGGSACTDGGAGMLRALGVRITAADGSEAGPGGAALRGLAGVDLSGLDSRLAGVEVILASDVDNPLCGPKGAPAVYGPQKGADLEQVETLDAALYDFAGDLSSATGRAVADSPGAGAAGGVGFAAMAALGARRCAGSDVMLDLVGFDRELDEARLVITGEGALDEQTLYGKAPAAVADRARAAGVPVVAVAGKCSLDHRRLSEGGFSAVYALSHLQSNPDRSLQDAEVLLVRLAEHIAEDWL